MIDCNSILKIDREHLFERANKRFLEVARLENTERKKHQKMLQEAIRVHDEGALTINPSALVSLYDNSVIGDGYLDFDGIKINFDYLRRLDKNDIRGLYLYVLTVGECSFESEEKIMDFLFADIWGTVYVDAAESELRSILEKDFKERFSEKYNISKSMGPGYFGMSTSESNKFAEVLDYNKIGVKVNNSGMLIPQKSCAGFYLVMNGDDFKFPNECQYCSGRSLGCEFCRIRGGRFNESKI